MNSPNHLALWAGLAALFTNLAAINVIALIGDETDARVTAIAAIITAFATAAAVFAKQKMDDAKAARARDKQQP